MRPKSIDEEFNDSYQNQGLQPRGLGTDAANDNDINPRRVSTYAGRYQAANDNQVNSEFQAANTEGTTIPQRTLKNTPDKSARSKKIGRAATLLKPAGAEKITKKLLRKKVAGTNSGLIYSWAWFAYGFQFIFAAISIAFFGIATTVEGLANSGGITGAVVGTVVSAASFIATVTDSILGTDFSTLGDPATYFLVAHTVAFLIGLCTLFAIGLIYQITLTPSLFGDGSTWKVTAVILAIFGYFTPFLNLIPWFFVWTFAVWLYPR